MNQNVVVGQRGYIVDLGQDGVMSNGWSSRVDEKSIVAPAILEVEVTAITASTAYHQSFNVRPLTGGPVRRGLRALLTIEEAETDRAEAMTRQRDARLRVLDDAIEEVNRKRLSLRSELERVQRNYEVLLTHRAQVADL